jgi:hypothetical protein
LAGRFSATPLVESVAQIAKSSPIAKRLDSFLRLMFSPFLARISLTVIYRDPECGYTVAGETLEVLKSGLKYSEYF